MEGVGVLSDGQGTFIDPRNGLPMLLLTSIIFCLSIFQISCHLHFTYLDFKIIPQSCTICLMKENRVQYCETQLSFAININQVSSCGFVQYHLYIYVYIFHNHTKRTISKADLFKRISLLIETRVDQILGV